MTDREIGQPTDRPWPANGNSLPNGGNHQFSGHRNACSLFRSPPEFEASAVRHCLPAPNTSIFHFMLSDKIHTISTNIEWNGEIHFVFRINNEYTIYYCKSMRLKSISADEWCAQTPALFLRIVAIVWFAFPNESYEKMCNVQCRRIVCCNMGYVFYACFPCACGAATDAIAQRTLGNAKDFSFSFRRIVYAQFIALRF